MRTLPIARPGSARLRRWWKCSRTRRRYRHRADRARRGRSGPADRTGPGPRRAGTRRHRGIPRLARPHRGLAAAPVAGFAGPAPAPRRIEALRGAPSAAGTADPGQHAAATAPAAQRRRRPSAPGHQPSVHNRRAQPEGGTMKISPHRDRVAAVAAGRRVRRAMAGAGQRARPGRSVRARRRLRLQRDPARRPARHRRLLAVAVAGVEVADPAVPRLGPLSPQAVARAPDRRPGSAAWRPLAARRETAAARRRRRRSGHHRPHRGRARRRCARRRGGRAGATFPRWPHATPPRTRLAMADRAMARQHPADALLALDAPAAQPLPPRGSRCARRPWPRAAAPARPMACSVAEQQQALSPSDHAALESQLAAQALHEAGDANVLAERWETLPKPLRTDAGHRRRLRRTRRRAALGRCRDAQPGTGASMRAGTNRWLRCTAACRSASSNRAAPARSAGCRRTPPAPRCWSRWRSSHASRASGRRPQEFLHRALAQGAGAEAWEELGHGFAAAGQEELARRSYANALNAKRGDAARSARPRPEAEDLRRSGGGRARRAWDAAAARVMLRAIERQMRWRLQPHVGARLAFPQRRRQCPLFPACRNRWPRLPAPAAGSR